MVPLLPTAGVQRFQIGPRRELTDCKVQLEKINIKNVKSEVFFQNLLGIRKTPVHELGSETSFSLMIVPIN